MQTPIATSRAAGESGARHAPPQDGMSKVQQLVGQGAAPLSVLRRRVLFVARFIYWSVRHCSTEHAAWVCNYEGLYW